MRRETIEPMETIEMPTSEEPASNVLTISTVEIHEPSEIPQTSSKSKKETKVNHSLKATETIKKIIRLFRKYIKDSDVYSSKSIEDYFTCTRFNFTQDTFDNNLEIFQELTCCTKGKIISEYTDNLKLLYIVFNKSPSKGNLAKFFGIPIIQDLWWGSQETTQK